MLLLRIQRVWMRIKTLRGVSRLTIHLSTDYTYSKQVRRGRYAQHIRLCAAHFRRNKVRRLRELTREAEKRNWGFVVMGMRALEEMMRRSPPDV